jgi:hypothetical protein
LIQKIFADITSRKEISDFQVAQELRKGVGRAIVDSIILGVCRILLPITGVQPSRWS